MISAVIGNPENRRVTMWQAALAAKGLPPARVCAWRDVLTDGFDARAGELVRIDSFGEDFEVERMLLARGERFVDEPVRDVVEELGRIYAPRQHHLGFLDVLAELERSGARFLQPIAAIRELFDKRAAGDKWRALGIPMPAPATLEDGPVFVKLTCGSSASCLAIVDGDSVVTTVEDTGRARYNTRKLQRLTGARGRRVVEFLLREGSVIERAVEKLRLDGRYCDLRVLVIAGEAKFVVARTSAHPITNLQVGGTRGDVDAVRDLVGAEWDRAMASCVAVQRASGAFHCGVDVAFVDGGHAVFEGNAFGDLLVGMDTYGAEIDRL